MGKATDKKVSLHHKETDGCMRVSLCILCAMALDLPNYDWSLQDFDWQLASHPACRLMQKKALIKLRLLDCPSVREAVIAKLDEMAIDGRIQKWLEAYAHKDESYPES